MRNLRDEVAFLREPITYWACSRFFFLLKMRIRQDDTGVGWLVCLSVTQCSPASLGIFCACLFTPSSVSPSVHALSFSLSAQISNYFMYMLLHITNPSTSSSLSALASLLLLLELVFLLGLSILVTPSSVSHLTSVSRP